MRVTRRLPDTSAGLEGPGRRKPQARRSRLARPLPEGVAGPAVALRRHGLAPTDLRDLQDVAGNAAVTRLLRSSAVRRAPSPRHASVSFELDPGAGRRLAVRRGRGRPLPPVLRDSMEPRFGADFSSVRLHVDREAADLSSRLHARAFTQGSDIYFAPGAYDPASHAGRHLLAHELTHVVQQGPHSVLQCKLVFGKNSYYNEPEVQALIEAYPRQREEILAAHQDAENEYTVTETRSGLTISKSKRTEPRRWHYSVPEGFLPSGGNVNAMQTGTDLGFGGLDRTAMKASLTGSITSSTPTGFGYFGSEEIKSGRGLKESNLARTHHLADSSIRSIVQYLHKNNAWSSSPFWGCRAVCQWLATLTGGSTSQGEVLASRLRDARGPSDLEVLVNELSNNPFNVGLGRADTNEKVGPFFDESRTVGGIPTPVSSAIAGATRQLSVHGVVDGRMIDAALSQLIHTGTGEILHSMTATTSSSLSTLGQTAPQPVTTMPIQSIQWGSSALPVGQGTYQAKHLPPATAMVLLGIYAEASGDLTAQFVADLDAREGYSLLIGKGAVFVVSADGQVTVTLTTS